MADYSIAAQGRAVKAPDIGAMLRQRAQMQAQQQAAQVEAAARQEKTAFERTAATDTSNKSQAETRKIVFESLINRAGMVGESPEAYGLWLAQFNDTDPKAAAVLAKAMPVDQFDPALFAQMLGSAPELFKARVAPRETEVVQYDNGDFGVAVTGGLDKPGVFELENYARKPPPTNNMPNPPRLSEGNSNAFVKAFPPPVDIDAAAAAIVNGASIDDPALKGLTQEQFGEAQRRASRMFLEKPISYEGQTGGQPPMNGAMPPAPVAIEESRKILQTAFQTGVINASNLEILRQTAGGNDQGLADTLRQNNVRVMPNEAEVPGMNYAVYRPGEDVMPQRQNVQSMGDYNPTGQAARGRDLNQGQIPGIYGVPTPDVAATSRARRPSAGELYDAEAAKIRAARDAGPTPLTPQQKTIRKTEVAKAYTQTQGLINKTYDPKEGVIALARKIKMLSDDQKEAITGFSSYVPSFRGSTREADTLFGNLKGVITAAGKDAASASGSIGPVAVQEWKIVADQIANLDLANMTPRALGAQMDRIIRQVSNATELAQQTYDVQFGDDVKEYPAFKLKGIPPARTNTLVTKAPSGVSAAEWKAMTPAERKLWQ